jgi:hypothetical protein
MVGIGSFARSKPARRLCRTREAEAIGAISISWRLPFVCLDITNCPSPEEESVQIQVFDDDYHNYSDSQPKQQLYPMGFHSRALLAQI